MTKFLNQFSSKGLRSRFAAMIPFNQQVVIRNPEGLRSLFAGMGSTMSICEPIDFKKNIFLDDFNSRLKKLHKNDGLYRKYNYEAPATIADCWQDTGKFLSWAMSNYENEQNKTDGKK